MFNRCSCRLGAIPNLKREDAYLGQTELCASSQKPEYLAQDLLIKNVPLVYHNFQELFLEEKGIKALPAHASWDHTIPVQEGKEVSFGPIYQISEKELEALRDFITRNSRKGFIRESQLLAGALVLFVPKKDRKLQLVVNYQLLNNITIKDRYMLPLIHKMQDRLRGSTIFTKLDLRSIYSQIQIKEGEEWKIAF